MGAQRGPVAHGRASSCRGLLLLLLPLLAVLLGSCRAEEGEY